MLRASRVDRVNGRNGIASKNHGEDYHKSTVFVKKNFKGLVPTKRAECKPSISYGMAAEMDKYANSGQKCQENVPSPRASPGISPVSPASSPV